MWQCLRCNAEVDAALDVCPNCGADREGRPNPYLPPRDGGETGPPAGSKRQKSEMAGIRRRWVRKGRPPLDTSMLRFLDVPEDEPVAVSTFLSVPEAEVVRCALEAAGIRAWVGNAEFLTWFWQYGVAVNGATVEVRGADVAESLEVLWLQEEARDERGKRRCESCGADRPASWDACWSCGASGPREPDAGAPAEATGEAEVQPDEPPESVAFWAGNLAMAVIFLGSRGAPWAAAMWVGFIAACRFVELSAARNAEAESEEEEQADGGTEEPAEGSSDLAGPLAMRAWHAAVLGAISFPPLALYSIYLLSLLPRDDVPLSRANRIRCRLAPVFNLMALLELLMIAAAFLFVAAVYVGEVFGELFDASGMPDRWHQ